MSFYEGWRWALNVKEMTSNGLNFDLVFKVFQCPSEAVAHYPEPGLGQAICLVLMYLKINYI